jgi:superfamily II DNA or RNA helicase
MYYPWFSDQDFVKKIQGKKEIYENKLTETAQKRCLTNYQYAVSNFINPASPYSSLLLYFSTGVGKSTASISIAENFVRKNDKKVIVITKNKTLIDNFKSDLINVCSSYKEKKPTNYSFITYDSMKKSTGLSFTDKVIIIDEVHNLLGNTGYEILSKVLKNSKNYKLVLLSATPAYDSIKDMFQLSNLLNGKMNQYDLSKLKENGYMESIIESKEFYNNDLVNLTPKGETSLIKNLHGKVSYLKSDSSDFPSIEFPNSRKSLDGKQLSLPVIVCRMEEFQNKRYLAGVSGKKLNVIEGIYEYLSSMIYPDDSQGGYVFGKLGMENYIDKNKTDFLLKKNVINHSTKLYNLLENLGDPSKLKGKIFINARTIKDDGVPLISACLYKNGYTKVITITSDVVTDKIVSKIEEFNRPGNDNGEKYQILIASGIISEGITLKSIKQIHIYEPSWNYSSIDQIIGRGVRKNSHARLPLEKRKVEVYLYCAISSDLQKSVDFSKYYLATLKDKILKKFERLIAKDSFTCSLFKKQNIRLGEDGSRECDYEECNYQCNYEGTPTTLDSSTYNLFLHNKEKYEEISSKINKIFGKTNQISLPDLINKTGEFEEDLVNIIKYNPPNKVSVISNIYSLKNPNNKKKFGKIQATSTAEDKSKKVEFSLVDGKFFIEMIQMNGKSNKKNCLTGFTKQELIDIATKNNIVLPAKSTKAILCDLLKSLV